MLLVPNYDVVIPEGEDVSLMLSINKKTYNRQENRAIITLSNEAVKTLPFLPLCTEWLQIFSDTGEAIINRRIKNKLGGTEFSEYNVFGNTVIFTTEKTGTFTVVCDTNPALEPGCELIAIKNSQGFLTNKASLFVEPLILTEPMDGYARLTQDRKSIAYKPKLGFYGADSFTYCLITNHGQYSKNYCVDIFIPAPPKKSGVN